jgi:membrane protease YdiL (CAAX protease family)
MDAQAAEQPRWRRVWDHPLVAMLVALALVVGTMLGLSWLFDRLPKSLTDSAGGAVPTLVSVALLFTLYKLVIRKLGDRNHDDLELPGAVRWFLLGAGGGALLITAVVGIAALLGVYRVAAWEMGDDFAMIMVQGGILAGFVEELIFRGVLFRWLEEVGGSWAALALTSLLFGLAHAANDGATVISTVAIMFEAGILLGAAYMYARSLWLPIGLHFAWNFTEGFVFDVPVSGHPVEGLVEARISGAELLTGGAFGLEASVIALIVCTTAGLWLVVRAVRAGRSVPPRWKRASG